MIRNQELFLEIDGGGGSASATLQSLLGPNLSEAEFFHRIWEKKALLVRRDASVGANFFSDLGASKAALLAACERAGFELGREINASRVGPTGDKVSFNGAFGRFSLAKAQRLEESEGVTWQIVQPQRFSGPLLRLIAALEDRFACLVGCNSYSTPQGTQGLAGVTYVMS